MAKTVKVYSTPTCPWCNKTKAFLKEHGVKFESIDVSADEKAARDMIKKSGQTGVPVIEIDKEIIVGFQEDKLRQLLKIK